MSANSTASGRSPWRRRILRPWLILPVVVALAAGGWLAFGRNDKTTPASATAIERTVEVTAGKLDRTVSTSGTIEAAQTEDLSFTSSGTVTAVKVKAGDVVEKGEVLATIDSADLASAVTQAEASVADAEAKLSTDQSASATSAQLAADVSNLASLRAQLTSAQTALDGAALVSPIDGTISTIDLTVGQQLGDGGTSGTGITGTGTGSGQSSSTLGSGSTGAAAAPGGSDASSSASTSTAQVQVVSTGTYLVKLNVDDTSIQHVKVGQYATITLSSAATDTNRVRGFFGNGATGGEDTAAGQSTTTTTQPATATAGVTGRVLSVGTVASASSGVATFPVDVVFTGSAGTYHAGATAQVEITYASIADAIQVPAQAVTVRDGRSTVVVSTGGKKQTRVVRIGQTVNGMVQVTSGLEAGQQVVVSIATPGRLSTTGRTGGGTGGGFQPPVGFPPGGGGGQ